MKKADSRPGRWWDVVFFLIALLVLAADQLTKIWIRSNLTVNESLFELAFFRVIRVHNTGAAFGLLQGQSLLLTIVAIVGIMALLFLALFAYGRVPFLDGGLGKPALGLILGGTAGNLADRLRLGYVTDFVEIGIWPTFNVADSAVVIGAILFACSFLFWPRAGKT